MSETTNEFLEKIIQREQAAVESYEKVLASYGDDKRLDALRDLSSEHIQAIQYFIDAASKTHDEIDIPGSSGAWGTWAALATTAATHISAMSSLRILKEGEEHGIKLYKEALDSASVATAIKPAISTHFIPQQRRHIEALNSLMDRLSDAAHSSDHSYDDNKSA